MLRASSVPSQLTDMSVSRVGGNTGIQEYRTSAAATGLLAIVQYARYGTAHPLYSPIRSGSRSLRRDAPASAGLAPSPKTHPNSALTCCRVDVCAPAVPWVVRMCRARADIPVPLFLCSCRPLQSTSA